MGTVVGTVVGTVGVVCGRWLLVVFVLLEEGRGVEIISLLILYLQIGQRLSYSIKYVFNAS